MNKIPHNSHTEIIREIQGQLIAENILSEVVLNNTDWNEVYEHYNP